MNRNGVVLCALAYLSALHGCKRDAPPKQAVTQGPDAARGVSSAGTATSPGPGSMPSATGSMASGAAASPGQTQPTSASASRPSGSLPMARGAVSAVVPGGRSWQVRKLDGAGDLVDIAFFDAMTGVIVGADGSLDRTTDGGRNWRRTAEPNSGSSAAAAAIAVVGPGSAFVLTCAPDTIRRTTDGGQSWRSIPLPPGAGRLRRQAVSMGDYLVMTTGGSIHRWTEAAGWTTVAQLRGTDYTDFAFPHRRHGYAIAGGDFPHVAVTSDGGATWLKTRLPEAADGTAPPGSGAGARVQFLDDQKAFLLADPSPLLATTDGGRSWTALDVGQDTAQPLTGLHFVDARTGYVVSSGDDGKLVAHRTTDAGATWERLPPLKLPGRVRGFTFSAAGEGFAVGDSGMVARLPVDSVDVARR